MTSPHNEPPRQSADVATAPPTDQAAPVTDPATNDAAADVAPRPPVSGEPDTDPLAAPPGAPASAPPPLASISGPAADPAPEPAPEPAAVRRGGMAGLLLGGILAAGLGYGLAQLVPQGWPLVAPLDQLQALESRLAALDGRVETLATAEATPPAELAALTARLDALGDPGAAIAELQGKVTTLDPAPAIAAIADLQARLTRLEAEVAALPQAGSDLAAELAAIRAAATEERAATEARLAAARIAAEATARAGLVQGAILRVQAVLDTGGPLDAALAELQAAGVAVPAALIAQAGGVATLATLQDDFPDAARAALAVVVAPAADAPLAERLAAFVTTQTGLRSLTPREGDDPDAILSRAEAALQGGDLAAALAEIAALPEPAQAALAGWHERALARQGAEQALAALARDLKTE